MEIRNLLVGLSIGEKYTQIAYYDRKMRDAVCLTTRAGKEQPAFPTSLTCLIADREWHFGREAEYFAARGEGEAVRDLYGVFESERPVTICGERFEPWQLMKIFIREALETLGVNDILSNLSGIMITTPVLGRHFARNASRAMEALCGQGTVCSALDDLESFYFYSISKNIDTIRKPVCLLETDGAGARLHVLRGHQGRSYVTANVETRPEIRFAGLPSDRDGILLTYLTESLAEENFSACYIPWDGPFTEDFPLSAAFLTAGGRRAFAGSNLFVKGACFAAKEKAEPVRTKNIIFLGKDIVRYNIGMELIAGGARTYVPLIAAGRNWYDNGRKIEMIPSVMGELLFRVSGMDDGSDMGYTMALPELEQRPEGAVRLRITAECVSDEECVIEVSDLGFGGLYPSEGKRWRCTIPLTQNGGNCARREVSGKLAVAGTADVPYPLPGIGADACSIEEICYFLLHYPELLDDSILSEALCDWFEEELHMPRLAENVRAALRDGNDLMACILPILKEGGYAAEGADPAYRKAIAALMRDSRALRMKKKGDALAGFGKYISALSVYRTVLSMVDERREDPVFMSSLYYNMGAVYMHMLLYEESLDCFKKAYIRFHTRESLKNYLMAAAIARPKSKYEEILKNLHVDDTLRDEIDRAIAASLRYDPQDLKADPEEIIRKRKEEYRSAASLPGRGGV